MADDAASPGTGVTANATGNGAGTAETPTTETAELQGETATAQANDTEYDVTNGTGALSGSSVARFNYLKQQMATANGQGFQFTSEEVAAQLNHCKEQLADLRLDLADAQNAYGVMHPPARDDASVAQAQAVKNMLGSVVSVIQSDIDYLTQWQQALTDAQNRYNATEHAATDQSNRLAQGL